MEIGIVRERKDGLKSVTIRKKSDIKKDDKVKITKFKEDKDGRKE